MCNTRLQHVISEHLQGIDDMIELYTHVITNMPSKERRQKIRKYRADKLQFIAFSTININPYVNGM